MKMLRNIVAYLIRSYTNTNNIPIKTYRRPKSDIRRDPKVRSQRREQNIHSGRRGKYKTGLSTRIFGTAKGERRVRISGVVRKKQGKVPQNCK
jgi:hypothetical protein